MKTYQFIIVSLLIAAILAAMIFRQLSDNKNLKQNNFVPDLRKPINPHDLPSPTPW